MSELEEYKKEVQNRLNTIGSAIASILSSGKITNLDLFTLSDNEFGEFIFGLDTLVEELIQTKESLTNQNVTLKKRTELWQKLTDSFNKTDEFFLSMLTNITQTYDIDYAGYFQAKKNDRQYHCITAVGITEEERKNLTFTKNWLKLNKEKTFTVVTLAEGSRLYTDNPPAGTKKLAAFVKEKGIKTVYVIMSYDVTTEKYMEFSLGSTKFCTLTDQELQTISGLAFVQFSRYNQILAQNELKKTNNNLSKQVAKRTHELSVLNNRLKKDLTIHEKTQKELKENINTYRTLFNSIPDPLLTLKLDGQIVSVNPAAVQLFNALSEEDLCRHNINEFIKDQNFSLKQTEFKNPIRYTVTSLTGSKYICEATIADMIIESKALQNPSNMLLVLHDISLRDLHEKKIARIKNLESLGIFAGGLAHDFNNILSGITGNLFLASQYLETNGKKAKSLLDNAHNSIVFARSLTNQLLTFSNGGSPVKKIVDINEILSSSISFALAGSAVGVNYKQNKELWFVDGDPSQLTQVFTNIILNAAQEVKTGVIDIDTEVCYFAEKNTQNLPKGTYVHIMIADRGRGIAPEIAPYIFHPFYTTKEGGSGLGLSIVHSIVSKHNGSVFFVPRQGGGTVFHIYFLATSRSKERIDTSEDLSINNIQKTKETDSGVKSRLLVMDDDDTIRAFCLDLMSFLGFDCVTVRDGEEAIKAYTEAINNNQPFKAVFLDLTIVGGMGGKETIAKLKEIDPNIYAIVVSGYSNDPVMSNYKDYGFKDLLSKPYTIGELKQVLKFSKK